MRQVETILVTEEQLNHELKVQEYITLLMSEEDLDVAERAALEANPQDEQAILDAVFQIHSGCF